MLKQSVLAAAALLALATPAAATSTASQPPGEAKRAVNLSGYDLNSEADLQALTAEIRDAAREVCAPVRKDTGSRLSYIGCVNDSSRDAMRQLEQARG